jgi:cyclopropane fatty-acyl-phospholipid synthase-like methyltransferase
MQSERMSIPAPMLAPAPSNPSSTDDPRDFGLAAAADPHRLYERAVQCAEAEVEFFERRFQLLRGRPARRLREDFCGTAAVCCEWVGRHRQNRAVGVDIDADVLDWGRAHNLSKLSPGAAKRVELRRGNVLEADSDRYDIISAMNFSYWLFKERAALRQYFCQVRAALADDGVFFLDAYGGYDAFREILEEREVDDADGRFTYGWEQVGYNPITGEMTCHIHFAFPDGSRLQQAFSYQWRLWTLPEIRELLAEAGFGRVVCYWQGWDAEGEADGVFEPADRADADAGWICYISAEP